MKTNNISTWATLLTVSGILSIAPLTVTAQNLTVSNSAYPAVSGTHYENNPAGTSAALTVSGSNGFFTGANIVFTGTAASGNGARGVVVGTGGTVELTDSAVNSNAIGINLSAISKAVLNNVNVTTQDANAYGLSLASSSTATITGGTIRTSGTTAYGINMNGNAVVSLNEVSIITGGGTAHGIHMVNSSTLTVTGGTITTAAAGSRGVDASGSSKIYLQDLTMNTAANAIMLVNASDVVLEHVSINSGGDSVHLESLSTATISYSVLAAVQDGINLTNNSLATVRDTTISGSRFGVYASGTAIITGGTVTAGNIGLFATGSVGLLVGTDVYVSTQRDGAYAACAGQGATLQLTGGTLRTSGSSGFGVHIGGEDVADTKAVLTGVDIQTTGADAHAVHLQANDTNFAKIAELRGGTYAAAQGSGIAVNTYGKLNTFNNGNHEIIISGGALISGTSAVEIYGDNTAVVTTVNISVSETSALNGDMNTHGNSVTAVSFSDYSTLTGKTTVNDNSSLTVRLTGNANWNMTGKSKVTTLSGANGGSITINNVEGEDLIVSGGISGQTALNLTLSDSVKGQEEIWVVVDETNAMNTSAFVLGREVSAGMYQYELVNATDGAWLVYTGSSGTTPPVIPPIVPPVVPPVPPAAPIISPEGDAVLNTAAAVAGFWFTQLDNLHKRMGELRYNKPAGGDVLDNVWVRAYGQQINANTGIYSVKGFSETQYGVDLGTDKAWSLDKNNTLYTGVFVGYGGADRDFHTSYQGSTDSGYGGLYGTWLNKDGWYADAVAKGQYFRNDFSGEDKGRYDSVGVGLSLELGKTFEFKDGWFAEPSVQFSYLHLMNDNYTTRDGMSVTLSDADVLHIYGGARFGRNIKLTNSGLLQPYVKFGGLGQISSGNQVIVSGDHWRPNLDGARAVIGAGVVWQLNADSQLHLDYEASFGEKYDKPWGVNFGYRYQF